LRWTLALLWVLILLVAVDYWLYRGFMSRIRRATPPTWLVAGQGGLPADLMRRVGYFKSEKRSSFVYRKQAKPSGVTRLCAFGDSFTHGDEVGDLRDYPTLLQQELDVVAPRRYEVLNFGVSSFGFHQAFMMWEALGSRYGCDELLLGPATFFPDRDTSFNHAGPGNPYYLHARYVLHGEGVRLVETLGDSLQERFDAYHRFVPLWRYARYDRSPPAFLRALLPADKTLENPVYYASAHRRDEATESYRRLLGVLTASGAKVRLGAGPDLQGEIASLEEPTIDAFTVRMPSSFPYRAPHGHLGPLGNQLIAQQFASRIVPELGEGISVLQVTDRPFAEAAAVGEPRRSLAEFGDVQFRLNGTAIAHFVAGDRLSRRQGAPGLLRKLDVGALIQIGDAAPDRVTGTSTFLDGCFLPLRKVLADSPEVCLRVEKREGVVDDCDAGRVRLFDQSIGLGSLAIDGVAIEDRPVRDEENRLTLSAKSPERQALLGEAQRVSVTIDDTVVLTGSPAPGGFRLSPGESGCLRVRANDNGLVDVRTLAGQGVIDLSLRGAGRNAMQVPVADWKKLPLPAETRNAS